MPAPGPDAKECPHCDMGIESAKCDCVDEPFFWTLPYPYDDAGTLGLKARQQEREE